MKVQNILNMVDSAKPNDFSEEVKLTWICDVEGRAKCEIHGEKAENVILPVGEDDELSIPAVYSRVYTLYLLAMIEFSSGNVNTYRSLIADYEAAFSMYARYVIRNKC